MPNKSANGWSSGYKIDYSKPGAQAYINAIAAELAEWGMDFFKLDGAPPDPITPISKQMPAPMSRLGRQPENSPDVRSDWNFPGDRVSVMWMIGASMPRGGASRPMSKPTGRH